MFVKEFSFGRTPSSILLIRVRLLFRPPNSFFFCPAQQIT